MATSRKILLVQPHLGDNQPLAYPLGLAYMASSLEGYEVKILDMNTERDPYAALGAVLDSFGPEVVGLSLRNIDNQRRMSLYYYYKDFESLAKNVKAARPDVKLITGGAGFSIFAEQIMKRNPSIDFGVYLEGEETLPELLENMDNPGNVKGIFFRENGAVKFTGDRPYPDFGALPAPRRDLLDASKYSSTPYSIGVQTKRGCNFDCAYCNYPVLNGSTLRLRTPGQVVDEIEELVRVYNVRQFMFTDSVFNYPLQHARDICTEIIKRGIKVNWAVWLDIRYVDEEFLLLAREAGCSSIAFSPDAASQRALDTLRKGIREEDIRKTLRLFTQIEELRDIELVFFVFQNPPGNDLWGIFKTFYLYARAKLALRGRGGVFLNWIRIEPDTEVYKIALEDKIVDEQTDLLPADAESVRRLFYSRPRLRCFDYVMLAFLKSIFLIKKLLGRK